MRRRQSLIGWSGSGLFFALRGGDYFWIHVLVAVILRLGDLDEIWNIYKFSVGETDLGALHDLDLETRNILIKLDVTDSNFNEIVFRLTNGNLVALAVLQGLRVLVENLSSGDDLATDGHITVYDFCENVYSGHTDGDTSQELVLKGLDVGDGAEIVVIRHRFDDEINLVVAVVEIVALTHQ